MLDFPPQKKDLNWQSQLSDLELQVDYNTAHGLAKPALMCLWADSIMQPIPPAVQDQGRPWGQIVYGERVVGS